MNNINNLLEIAKDINSFAVKDICKEYEKRNKIVLSATHKIVISDTLNKYFEEQKAKREEMYSNYITRWCYLQGTSHECVFCDGKIAFATYDSDIGLSIDVYASYEEIFNDCFSYNIRETILDCVDVLEDEFNKEEINKLKTLVGIDFVTDEEVESLTNGYQGLIYDFCNALEPVIKNHKEMFVSKNGEYEPETIAKDMSNTMWCLEHMHGIYEDGFNGDTKYNDMFYDHAEEILKHLKLEMYHDLETDEYKIIRKGE